MKEARNARFQIQDDFYKDTELNVSQSTKKEMCIIDVSYLVWYRHRITKCIKEDRLKYYHNDNLKTSPYTTMYQQQFYLGKSYLGIRSSPAPAEDL